ncbi:RabGAP/TBC [Fistulina hepatica ATCC 64428]|uniref:RabGAP/TBC n=1 Tax=Fistulina hepatica ATCC 64428 TaxID=1128425 RepID=A0A0D7AFZ9_9AGAR|nr:RabGAP/TBC [Fistulina hepatica ATCC 64428]
MSAPDVVASSSSSIAQASTLDSLLSPKNTVAFVEAQTCSTDATNPDRDVAVAVAAAIPTPTRESVTESEFNDVSLEDDSESGFSQVALSSRNSVQSSRSSFPPGAGDDHGPDGDEAPSTKDAATNLHSSHAKSASMTTLHSTDSQVVDSPDEHEHSVHRLSADGQQKLRREFTRLQKDHEGPLNTPVQGSIDWEFWGAVMSDYQKFAAEHPDKLATAIAKGIPGTLRGMMWQLMAASKDVELENTYVKLLKETSPHEKAITRDLGRTFPHHAFFTDGHGIGQENLFNVLKAYSLYDPQVGYCQGLPFVVAILLLNMPDEEAFSLLVRLMHDYGLQGHFLPEMPKLQLRLFDRLMEEMLPVLHVHFLRQGIKSSMFCSQWYLTMFSYRFPLDAVFRIYDRCLASGIESILSFSIALLQANEEALLKMKFDEMLSFLNLKLFDVFKNQSAEGEPPVYDIDLFVQNALLLRITPFMLDSYSHEYEELMRETNKHAMETDSLRNSNRMLTTQVKTLETNMAALNTEHVEILNELVKARLRNEELEDELVRYKLLYAEAMHQNEDAQSQHSQRMSQLSHASSKNSISMRKNRTS